MHTTDTQKTKKKTETQRNGKDSRSIEKKENGQTNTRVTSNYITLHITLVTLPFEIAKSETQKVEVQLQFEKLEKENRWLSGR